MTDSTLNRFIAVGTNAERTAFTPSVPTPASGPDQAYFWYETDTGNTYAYDGASWNQVNGGLSSIANVRVLANISGGSAAPTANTLTAVIDACISGTQGDILYRNGTVWTALGAGTSGYYLKTQGAGANPTWAVATPVFSGAKVTLAGDWTAQDFTTAKAIPFDSETFDVGGWHDNVTNNTRLTVPSGVSYVSITGQVTHANGSTGTTWRSLKVFKNGVEYAGFALQGFLGAGIKANTSCIADVTAGDYFELYFQVQSDTSSDLNASYTNFSIVKLG